MDIEKIKNEKLKVKNKKALLRKLNLLLRSKRLNGSYTNFFDF